MSFFNEIFDSSDIEPAVPAVVKTITETTDGALPLDDPLWAYSPRQRNISKSVKELFMLDELEQIVGPCDPSPLFAEIELAKLDRERQFYNLLNKGGRAGLLLKKHVQRGETPQEAMQYAVDLFAEKFTPDALDKAKRAIKALDLASFLQLLTNAMAGD